MSKNDIKELAGIIAAMLAAWVAFALCVATVVGIPAAAIVWIIQAFRG